MNLKFIFIFSFLLINLPINAQQGWFWQNPLPTGNHLECVCFVDQNNGWAVGWYGTILRTTNGGDNWIFQFNGATNTLYGVSFTDLNNGTVVGGGWTGINF